MTMIARLLVLLVFSCWCTSVSTQSIIPLNSICDPNLQKNCHNMADVAICYDGLIFHSWCKFFDAGCDGSLRPNVSTIHSPSDPSCVVQVVIKPPPTTTTYTPTTFEEHFFKAAIHSLDELLVRANASGATLEQQKKIFSLQDHAHKRYVRNTQCWAYPLDLTSISPWNDQGHTRRAGVLITPRHALWARHYSMPVNTTIRFIDRNNSVVDRLIVKVSAVPTDGHDYLSGYDIVVGELDRDVPPTISFAKVMPKDLSTIRPHGVKVPVFGTDFEEKALVANLNYENGNLVGLETPPNFSIRFPYFEPKITGDSGNPEFLAVDDEIILLFTLTYGGAGSGTSITFHHDAINNIIKHWGSGYQLTDADLTRFLDDGNQIPHIIG